MQMSTETTKLTESELESYQDNGCIVVEDLVSPDELKRLQQRVHEYTHGGRSAHAPIRFQTEPRVARGELKVDHPGDGYRKIDKLVEGDDLFYRLGTNAKIVGILEQILGSDIKMFRNAMLLKPPGVGSPKGMHQDSPYWCIEPMALCSCWFAIDNATSENGCMAVLPGRHKKPPMPHIRVTDDYVADPDLYDMNDAVLLPVKAGGGLFFHSLLPHYTGPNQSRAWRRAIALSYMSAKSKHTGKGECPQYTNIKGQTFPGSVRGMDWNPKALVSPPSGSAER